MCAGLNWSFFSRHVYFVSERQFFVPFQYIILLIRHPSGQPLLALSKTIYQIITHFQIIKYVVYQQFFPLAIWNHFSNEDTIYIQSIHWYMDIMIQYKYKNSVVLEYMNEGCGQSQCTENNLISRFPQLFKDTCFHSMWFYLQRYQNGNWLWASLSVIRSKDN